MATSSSAATAPVTSAPVLVTGAGGYVAAHLVQQLLSRGYRVRGTVRDPSKESSTAHLTALDGAADNLELVAADLLQPETISAACEGGVEYVMHVASPYALNVQDPQRDLVDPALQGTKAVLEACKASGTVKRVVLTSSVAAISDQFERGKTYTEDDWNETSSLTRSPYYYSKTLAEREAWRFVEEELGEGVHQFDLVVINPFVVLGPHLQHRIHESSSIIVRMLNGDMPGLPDLAFGYVDVRDVAEAHIRGMETPEAAGNRYICANQTLHLTELARILAEQYPEHPVPRGQLWHMVVYLAAMAENKGTRDAMLLNLGRGCIFSNDKIKNELGMNFRPIEDTVRDQAEDLIAGGHVNDPATRGRGNCIVS